MKMCPVCGGKRFVVTAHVTQDWVVDGNENYLKTIEDCVDITHRPDNEDIWECYECGYSASGSEFEV